MKINEINFDTMETVRKKCIKFARDMNTVVKPWKSLYRLQDVTQDEAHKSLYIEVMPQKYGSCHYQLWEELGPICMGKRWLQGYWDIEETADKIKEYYKDLGIDGFLGSLEESEKRYWHINKAEIEVCALLGKTELAAHYAEYREKRNTEKEAQRAAHRAECEAHERARLAELERTVQEAENAIRSRQTLKNEKFEGSTIVLYLIKKHGVNVPLKTQGWINNRLASVTYEEAGSISCSFWKKPGTKGGSTVIFRYLKELEEKILKSA